MEMEQDLDVYRDRPYTMLQYDSDDSSDHLLNLFRKQRIILQSAYSKRRQCPAIGAQSTSDAVVLLSYANPIAICKVPKSLILGTGHRAILYTDKIPILGSPLLRPDR